MFGHPWRALRHLPHITVVWADLPGDLMGHADFDTDTIVLDRRLTQAERRTTCWHEVQHLLRGPVGAGLCSEREERDIEEIVARDLIPFHALVDAMKWSLDDHEIAEDLTVDVHLVRARLEGLTDVESLALEQALDNAELDLP